MKTRFLFSWGLLLVIAFSSFAQTKEAIMFSGFNFRTIRGGEVFVWVDDFADEILKTSESKGYIIYYGGRTNPYGNKLPQRNESKVSMKDFMEDNRVSMRLGSF